MPFGFLDDLFTSEQTQSGTSTASPWGPAIPGLTSIADLISGAVGEPLQFFPGQTYAPQTEAELEQIQALMEAAQAWGGTVMAPWMGALQAPDVANNPYVTGMAEAIEGRVGRALEEDWLPAATMGSWAAGDAPGGTGLDLTRGTALRGAADVMSENLADLYGGAYRAGLGAQQGALSMAPGMMGGAAGFYGQAGGLERAEDQRAIDEEMARFQFGQLEPYQRAQLAAGTLLPIGQGFPSMETTQVSTSTPSTFQQLASIGSLAMGGMGLAGMGPMAGMMGGGMGGMGGGMMPPMMPPYMGYSMSPYMYG